MQHRAVPERTTPGLHFRMGAEPDRAALHEHDRMMPVPAGHGGRQPEHVFCLRARRHRLEADRREMVALVNHEMAVTGHQVVDLAPAHQALDHAHIDDAARPARAAADPPDGRRGQIEERAETGEPLVHQLAAVNEDEGIGPARGDDRGRHHRLAEPGRGRQHAGLVREQRIGGGFLLDGQLPKEGGLDGAARIALVAEIEPNAVFLQQRLQFPAAAARQGDMVR